MCCGGEHREVLQRRSGSCVRTSPSLETLHPVVPEESGRQAYDRCRKTSSEFESVKFRRVE